MALRLNPVKGPKKPDDPFWEWSQQFSQLSDIIKGMFTLLNGKFITVNIVPGDGTTKIVPHGLGRKAVGNIIVSNSNPSVLAQCGIPAETHIGIQLGSATTMNLSVYVF